MYYRKDTFVQDASSGILCLLKSVRLFRVLTYKIKCTVLLFNISLRFFNYVINVFFGNFEVLSGHHDPIAGSPKVRYGTTCTGPSALSVRKCILDNFNAISFFSVISIIPLIFTSGMGILLLASSIAFFISGESSISWMASRPFLDTASKAS